MWLQHEADVGVLLMDETGSVGLDLSFVSWVSLMEPLADASLQAQVTARAHRMGATQAVHVETLVMKVTLVALSSPVCTCRHLLQVRPADSAQQGTITAHACMAICLHHNLGHNKACALL